MPITVAVAILMSVVVTLLLFEPHLVLSSVPFQIR
jgi:hypothetical protein